jgi:hypothetical protein
MLNGLLTVILGESSRLFFAGSNKAESQRRGFLAKIEELFRGHKSSG